MSRNYGVCALRLLPEALRFSREASVIVGDSTSPGNNAFAMRLNVRYPRQSAVKSQVGRNCKGIRQGLADRLLPDAREK